jgi:hypothetical protein
MSTQPPEAFRGTVLWSNLGLGSLAIALLFLCYYTTADGRAYNYLLVMLGALVGWTLGIYWAPFSVTEQARFVTIGQAVGTFISGYFLSKIDRLLERSLFGVDAAPQLDTWLRLGLFAAATMLFALIVYTNRAYFRS